MVVLKCWGTSSFRFLLCFALVSDLCTLCHADVCLYFPVYFADQVCRSVQREDSKPAKCRSRRWFSVSLLCFHGALSPHNTSFLLRGSGNYTLHLFNVAQTSNRRSLWFRTICNCACLALIQMIFSCAFFELNCALVLSEARGLRGRPRRERRSMFVKPAAGFRRVHLQMFMLLTVQNLGTTGQSTTRTRMP